MMLSVKDLAFHYRGGGDILKGVSFDLPAGCCAAVLGNNDFDEYGSAAGHFAHPVLEGVRFLVGHKPGDVRVSFAGSAALAPGDPLPDVIIHGHTHVPELKTGPDARPAGLYLCPGAVYRPRSDFGRTIAKMDVEAGRILHTWVENLDGKVLLEA